MDTTPILIAGTALILVTLLDLCRGRRDRGRRRTAALMALVTLASACGDDDDVATTEDTTTEGTTTETATPAADTTETATTPAPEDPVATALARVEAAQSGVTDAEDALAAAGEEFCVDAADYVDALDRYGKLFTDGAATVGDVKTGGADLVEPRESVTSAATDVTDARTALAAAQQELIDAEGALDAAIATASSMPTSSTTPATVTTTTIVPPATIERVRQAEDDLAQTAEGITDATPLADATAEYNSAAFALEIAWLQLLSEAGCFTDEQQARAVEQVTAYTASLQTALQQVGLYEGPIDGIYGPRTVDAVKQLQADSGLRETGYVDQATAEALDAKLAEVGQQAAAAEMTQTAAVQTVLTLTGYWSGPIDGIWTDELTAALQEFQTALGVPPTGEVDTATLAAFEQALADLESVVTATTTTSPATSAPPTSPSPTSATTSESTPPTTSA